ncbi:MAG: alkaline phosphatase family protein [Chthoniobacterales bacterium]
MATSRRVLLIGWDSADWRVINPLLDAGKMPHLQQLVEGGVMGNMATLYPILSPMLWTSIATGKRAHKHGIYGFAEPDPITGGIRPITNLSRKTKAVWNILSQSEKKCIVVGWWPSHPVEPLPDGVMVSNHYQRAPSLDLTKPWPMAKGTVYPERLEESLAEVRLHPMELDGSHILPFIPKAAEIDQKKDRRLEGMARTLADCTSIHGAATSLIQSEPWDFMAVYFDAIDHFGHGFMRYHPPRQKGVSKKDFELYSGVIEAGYRYHDMMLGVLMAMAGPETTVMLLSDHGFHPDHLRPRSIPVEPAGPAIEHRHYGIFAMNGPGIKKDDRVYGATVLDICPTLLTLFGLPVGTDMDGKALVAAWQEPPEVKTVPSWDSIEGKDGRHPPDTNLSAEDSREALKQLEELGYIQPLPDKLEEAVAETANELQYNLACSYIDAQMPAAAMRIFAALWEEYPKEHRFGVKLLSCQVSTGRRVKARETLDKLRERQAKYAEEAQIELTKLQAEFKKKKGKKLKDLSPHEQQNLRQLNYLANSVPATTWHLEAMLLFAENKTEEALAIMEKMEKAGKTNPDFHVRIAQGHASLKNHKLAEASYKKALKLDPDHSHAHLGMAQIYLAQKRNYDAAGFALTATGLIYHNPQAHLVLGIALHRLGHIDRAVEAFRLCVNQNPNLLGAHRRLIAIYENRLKDPEKAELQREQLRVAIERVREARRRMASPNPEEEMATLTKASKSGAAPVVDFDFTTLPPARKDTEFATLVTGLPRSGTSLMMQMLVAGGIPALQDNHRPADEDNPLGYFEFAPAKNLRMDGSWMSHAQGRVLKLVPQLLPYLPPQHPYRVVFMERSIDEVLRSQRVMLDRHGKQGASIDAEKLSVVYGHQLEAVNTAIQRLELPVLRITHADAIKHPAETAARVAEFLKLPLDTAAMAAVIDPTLHRQRKKVT